MSQTVRTVNCPTCHNVFPQGRGAISMCPRCGERVLVPTLDEEEQAALRQPANETASVAVECTLCSSRFYAKPSQLGQKMKCPDCHTENVVVEAESRAPKKTLPKLSELTDEDDFKLSDPVETPRYQALTRDALEFERALRSQEGMDVKPLEVDARPVHRPAAEAKKSRPSAPPPPADDDLIDLGPEPETPPPAPKHHAAPEPAAEDDLIEIGPVAEAPSPPARETKPSEPQTPASPDDIDLFPEDRVPVEAPRPAAKPQARVQAEEVVDLGDEEEESRVEVRIAAPEKRMEYKPVITLPKADSPDDRDDGSEVDFQKLKRQLGGLMQGGGNSLPPELAKRKPFSPASLFIFTQPGILSRCVVLAGIVVAELWALTTVTSAMAAGHEAGGIQGAASLVAALFIYLPAFVVGILAFVTTAMFCLTIVQDTANGSERIESWPEMSMYAWFESALYFGAASFIAGLPGALLSGAFSTLGFPWWLDMLMSPMLLMTSLVILFPPILISMLEAGSVMEPMSLHMLRSFSPLRKFWIQFYLLSLAIGFVAVVVFHLAFSFGWLTLVPGAVVLTLIPFLYFRLVGRMAMMYRDYMAAITPDEEESGPVVRHVIQ